MEKMWYKLPYENISERKALVENREENKKKWILMVIFIESLMCSQRKLSFMLLL